MTSKRWRAVMLVTIGLVVGYLIGPPIVEAATSLVTIQGAGSTHKAKVNSAGRLLVDTEARVFGNGSLFTFALTEPSGETVIVSADQGTPSVSKSGKGDLVGVNLDVSQAGSQPVTLTLRRGTTPGSGEVLWQGTVPTGVGHIGYEFNQALLLIKSPTGFNVVLTNAGGAIVQYQVYGFGFGVACCAAEQAKLLGRDGS